MNVKNINNYSINFGTTYKKVNEESMDLSDSYESSTCFFKYDLQWNKFFNKIIEQYDDTPKVNVYSLACSDGSEAYSIAMLLMTKLGDKADKYFPIKAIDFDKDSIKYAQDGYIDLCADDELKINKYTNNQLNRYFERTNQTFLSGRMGSSDKRVMLTRFKVKPELREKVQFECEDIREYVEKIPDKNNLIFCRNCWPYLYKDVDVFTKKISEKVDKNSYLVTGVYDSLLCPMSVKKNSYGFSMNKDLWYVYDKSGSDFFDQFRCMLCPDFENE